MENGAQLIKLLAPQIPTLASTALWHTLGRTPTSSKWDLRTALTVEILRYFTGGAGRSKPSPVSAIQNLSCKPRPVTGKTWAAKTKLKAPSASEESLREAVFKAIDDMKVCPTDYTRPELVDLEVEWIGYRPNAKADEAPPAISEEEKYKRMMAEPTRTSETTILYLHGGAYYLCSLDTHRQLCSRLAKECNGRVCNINYRLAPQAAFPAQLLDAFTAYLSLLYPPPGSFHEPVPAKNIVIAGDSAGGNLSFALLQLLLQLHRTSANPTVKFFGKDVAVPMPAGVAANSGWFDLTRSMPSITDNSKTDYLPMPNHDDATSEFPKDSIWPTNPPRGDLFCDLSLLDHPLVSVIAADSWANSPPLWLNTGSEMLTDEDKFVVARAAAQGVTVHFEEYEAMPHCFPMLIPHLKQSDICLKSWGSFCKRAVEEPASLKTSGTMFFAKSGKRAPVDLATLSKLSMDDVKRIMGEAKERRLKGYDHEGKGMPKPSL